MESSGDNISLDGQDGIPLTVDVLNDGQNILWKTTDFSEMEKTQKTNQPPKYWFLICKQWPYANKW